MSWQYHQETEEKLPNRDFRQLNKLSVSQKCIRPKEVSNFRKEVDVREKVPHGRAGIELLLPDENFRYGKANKPSTPFDQILSF